MEKMKVCFVGIGSIARRHIKNLHLVCEENGIVVQIDAYRRSLKTLDGVENIYTRIEEVPNDYDAVFITNPTEMHLDTLYSFHEKGKHFFIEKPVVSFGQVVEAKKFRTRSNSVYYIATPLRYNPVIQWVKRNVDPDDVLSVRSISSSFLPDWRPGQDYRDTYSAHKDLGGGVSIDLIHEWDYLTYLFGWPLKVQCLIGKKSSLDIDSDDYAIYIAEYADKIAELHLDYFGKKTIREVQLFTKKDTIVGDLINNQIRFLVSGQEIIFHEERDDYQKRELLHFLNLMIDTRKNEDAFFLGLKVLQLTQGVLPDENYRRC